MRAQLPQEWDSMIDAVNPPALLLLIEGRMSTTLRLHFTAEDIWQEALLHAWRDRERCEWRGLKAFRSWLLSIIDNRIREAADYLGAQKRGGGRAAEPLSALAVGGRAGENRGVDTSAEVPKSTTPSRIAIQREQAEAAVRCGDLALGERLLDMAAELPMLDPGGGLVRVRAGLLAAQGRDEDAERCYQIVVQDSNHVAIFEYAEFLQARGRLEEAVWQFHSAYRNTSSERMRLAFITAADEWWESLTMVERLTKIREMLGQTPGDPTTLLSLLRSYIQAKG